MTPESTTWIPSACDELMSISRLWMPVESMKGTLRMRRMRTAGLADMELRMSQVIRTKPYMAQPYLLRALAKYNLDDFEGAIADATLAIERNPFLPDAWEVRGVSRQCIGDNRSAITDYAGALQLLPAEECVRAVV